MWMPSATKRLQPDFTDEYISENPVPKPILFQGYNWLCARIRPTLNLVYSGWVTTGRNSLRPVVEQPDLRQPNNEAV